MLNTSPLLTLVIAFAVVIFLIARQFSAREVNVVWLVGIPAVVAYFGMTTLGSVSPGTSIVLSISVAVAMLLGAARALTFRVWIGGRGVAMVRGTAATLGLWLVLVAARVGWYVVERQMGLAPDASNATGVLLPLAGTLAAQNVVVWLRAQSLGTVTA